MIKNILIKLFSALLSLITFILASVIITMLDSLHQTGDYTAFFIYTIPLPVAIAISGGILLQFVRTSNREFRLISFFIIAILASLGWLYVIFVLLWGTSDHAFSMPLFYLWVVGSFVQLIYLDRNLLKPTEPKPIWLNILTLLVNPIILFSLLFAVFYESKMYEKRKYALAADAKQAQITTYFTEREQNSQINDHLRNFRYMGNAHELHLVYQNIDNIYDGLAESLTAQEQRNGDSIIDLEPINAIVEGIHFEHYEGDAMLINPDIAAFKKAAEYTPEKCDDDFIAIMIATYGEEKYFSSPKWLRQTSDYGRGSSLLGDDIDLKILIKIQTALASSKEFEPELNEIRDIILYDILQAVCYEYDIPKIIAEINKITATIKLTKEEKAKISARLLKFKHPSKELQFDCEKKDCHCER